MLPRVPLITAEEIALGARNLVLLAHNIQSMYPDAAPRPSPRRQGDPAPDSRGPILRRAPTLSSEVSASSLGLSADGLHMQEAKIKHSKVSMDGSKALLGISALARRTLGDMYRGLDRAKLYDIGLLENPGIEADCTNRVANGDTRSGRTL